MDREPTVQQIVDRILALDCGESCNVKLNPRITRIANLEWLLPICIRQFGAEIAMREQMDGEDAVLTITVTATRKHKASEPGIGGRPAGRSEDEPAACRSLIFLEPK